VITPVSLDHTAILGPTVALIAGEKAGIVKRGRPVVCGARDPAARAVIEAVARKRRARLFLVDRDFTAAHLPPEAPAALGGGTLVYGAPAGARGGPRPPERYPLAMTGAHQADNAAMAVTAVRVLGLSAAGLRSRGAGFRRGRPRSAGRSARVSTSEPWGLA